MDHKSRILDVLNGKPTDSIPYIPRLDLWYNANKRAGTLPSAYRNATLFEIIQDLDYVYHGIIPNFKDQRSPLDELHRGLGIYNLACMPFNTRFENTAINHWTEGDKTVVEYVTPHGTVRTGAVHDENMKKAGITISHLSEHAVKSASDYKAVAHLFENAIVEPNLEGYAEFHEKIGGQGVAAAFISLAGSPMHLLLRELLPFDLFSYETFDHPDELAECARAIGGYYDRVFDVVAQCKAEIVLFGANYDAMLTHPPFFAEHIKPWLKKLGDKLHAQGKYLLTHTDGENTGLLGEYLESNFDIADSICPKPMTKLTFREVRDTFEGHGITIMGGIPSICLLKSSMSDCDFDAYLDTFFTDIKKGDRLLVGISDTTPPAADFERIKLIAKRIKEFGPVNPA